MTPGVLDLSNRRVLVTGGSRGIGRAVALLMARAGASVGISYRSRSEDADAVVKEIRGMGRKGWAMGGDLTSPEEVQRLFQHARESFGGVDVVVGNHGIWPAADISLAEMELDHWRRTLQVNLESIFLLARESARNLTDGGGLILVSSTAAQRGEPFHGDYAASKGGINALVKGLSVELGGRGITVNAVAPGWVDTEMTEQVLTGAARREALAGIPLGRIATAEDVAGPIAFLASPLGRHITGEVLNVNGGSVRPG